MKKALILDLDNTIYPVSAIAEHLFKELFAMLDQYVELINANDPCRLTKIKHEMTRRPFQHIADEFRLDEQVRKKMVGLLKNITYDLPMQPFDDYKYIQSVPLDKFLVTTGFSKLQWSKIKMLGIEGDFKHIHIVDPDLSQKIKKDVFAEIMQTHNYATADLLVIGDDMESEIKAAKTLGIDTFLYDPLNNHPRAEVTCSSGNLRDVLGLLK